MTLKISDIASNFSEILSVDNTTTNLCNANHPPKLIPFGNHIYNASRGWGRIICWFYKISSIFINIDISKHLQNSLLATQIAFKDQVQSIQEHNAKYADYIRKLSLNEKISEYEVSESRMIISEWNTYFGGPSLPDWNKLNSQIQAVCQPILLINSAEKNKCEKLNEKVIENEGEIKPASQINLKSDLGISEESNKIPTSLQNYQEIINLEGVTNTSIPIFILKELALKKELSIEHKEELILWIDKLNELKDWIKPNAFHRALHAIIQQVVIFRKKNCLKKLLNKKESKESKESKKESNPAPYYSTVKLRSLNHFNFLSRLELKLYLMNCTLLNTADSDHLNFRKEISKIKEINCNGKIFKLGRQLHSKNKRINDRYAVFPIKGDGDHVMIIAMNSALLGIQNQWILSEEWIIPPAKRLEIDINGSCALVERLWYPLNTLKWPDKDLMSEIETVRLKNIIQNLCLIIQKQEVSSNFESNHLMFNSNGELKSLKTTKTTGQFNFPALIDLAEKMANGNEWVFNQIIKFSEIQNHPYSKFFSIVINETLNEEQYACIWKEENHEKDLNAMNVLAASESITNPLVIDHALNIQKQILMAKEDWVDEIIAKFLSPNKKTLNRKIGKKVFYFLKQGYKELAEAGGFTGQFKEAQWKQIVIDKVVNFFGLIAK